MSSHRSPTPVRTFVTVGAGALVLTAASLGRIVTSSVGFPESAAGEAMVPEPLPGAPEAAQGDVRTYAPIFPSPGLSEPQPWEPEDGPIIDNGQPTEPASRSERATAAATRTTTTSPSPTPTPAAAPAPEPAPVETAAPATQPAPAGIVELVNRDRATAGCPPVTADPTLTIRAQQWAEQQAADNVMRHSSAPDGVTMWGENVAVGYDTEADVHQAWMDSAGHRANILNCEYRWIGIGHADGDSGRYWTEQFAA